MLLSASGSWLRVKPVRLSRLPPPHKFKGLLLSLPRSQQTRNSASLGVSMGEMTSVWSGSSRDLGVSIGEESDAFLGWEAVASETSWAHVEVALNRMSKWLVAGSLAFAALWKRDVQILWALNGAVVNTVLCSTLKKMLNHERPAPALRSDPGMPSSHAQSIFYAAVFLVLSVFYCLGTSYLTTILGAATVASASYLSWLRVSQRLHTQNQILVGAIVGSAFGVLWFALWHLLVQEALDSSLWVQIPVVLGSVVFYVAFAVYIIRQFLKNEW